MIVAASSVVLSNLMYLIGALLVMVVAIVAIVLRQRKPKSVEANMESFHRGLRALAPGPASPTRPSSTARPGGRRSQVQTVVEPEATPTTESGAG